MNPLQHPPSRHRILLTLARSTTLAALVLPAGGCSSTSLAKARSATTVVYQDATSPAGRKLLADLTSAALNVGLDIASGNDTGATVAGIQGAANTLRDYEGLPVAPSSATIARAAAAGSGVADVASTLAPSVEVLVDSARATATQQKVNIRTDDIIEAVARGFDAVADARYVPPAR